MNLTHMDIKMHGSTIAEIVAQGAIIRSAGDMLDIMANVRAQAIILRQENFVPDFFDLKTGLAGDILQKFSTYDKRLAIVGDFSNVDSKALRDLIYECNQIKRTIFVPSIQEAIDTFNNG